MAKAAGRLALLSKAGVAIGGVRVASVKWKGETIDVTDRDSAGVVELLATMATEQITLSVDGVAKDAVLRDIAHGGPGVSKLLTDVTFKYADALSAKDTISGNFMLTEYEESSPYDAACDFTATFVSSGAWVVG